MADNLPVEVLTHIFSFLGLSDRKEACLVNKLWYEASTDPLLQRNTIITLQAPQISGEILPGLSKKRIPHLILSHIDTSIKCRRILEKSSHYFGNNLQSLSLRGTDLTEGTFVSLMMHCKSLVQLDLSCCNSVFMSGQLLEKSTELQALQGVLTNVKTLNLSSIRYLSDATFNRMVTVCSNITKLSLASCQILFHGDFYGDDKTRFANNSVVTFHNLITFLNKQQKQIKSLNLSRTSIFNEPLVQLAKIPDLKLTEMFLVACRDVTDEGISGLVKHQKYLEHLDLSCCTDLTDNTGYTICSGLPKLKHLNLDRCRTISDISLKHLHQLDQLEVLDLSAIYQIMSEGLMKGLCTGKSTKLKYLSLNCCSAIRDDFVLSACRSLTNLVHLDIGSCYPITDYSVHSISKNLVNLSYLRLAWCKQITDFGLLGLVREDAEPHVHVEHGTCRCNRKTAISNIFNKPKGGETKIQLSWEEAESLLSSTEELYTLANLTHLRFLDLSACPNLSDTGLAKSIRFKGLQKLNLSMCPMITDKALVTIAGNNPSLEELQLSQCKHLTDDGIGNVVKRLPRLSSIDVSSCDLLTNLSLEMMAMHGRRLRNVDVSLCSGITMEGVTKLEQKCSSCSIQKRMISEIATI